MHARGENEESGGEMLPLRTGGDCSTVTGWCGAQVAGAEREPGHEHSSYNVFGALRALARYEIDVMTTKLKKMKLRT